MWFIRHPLWQVGLHCFSLSALEAGLRRQIASSVSCVAYWEHYSTPSPSFGARICEMGTMIMYLPPFR